MKLTPEQINERNEARKANMEAIKPFMDQAWEQVKAQLGVPELTEAIKALAQQNALNIARKLLKESTKGQPKERRPRSRTATPKWIGKFAAGAARLVAFGRDHALTPEQMAQLVTEAINAPVEEPKA